MSSTAAGPDPDRDTVLVTGATGFLAQHCILQLLEAGYAVRGTARAAGRTAEVAAILEPHLSPEAKDRLGDLTVVPADLTSDDGWAAAVAGCRYVLHVASPLPRTAPKDEREVIEPARDGVVRVLRAAIEAGVDRVVMTSSVAAVLYGRNRDRVFTEEDWSDPDGGGIGAYEKSKTVAERAAWDLMAANPDARTELTTVNPGLILGPILSPDWGTSAEFVKRIIDRDFPAIPNVSFCVVDVRDVAAAHVAAMTEPTAAGERFICAIESHSMREVAQVLADHLGPLGFRIPTRPLPSFLMRLVALWDGSARLALNDLDVRQDVDSTKIRERLGWQPRGFEEMVVATADSLVAQGVVKP